MVSGPGARERLGIIAGSAAHQALAGLGLEEDDLSPVETPFGRSSPVGLGQVGGVEVVVAARHGAGEYALAAPFVNYRANLYALKERGVTQVISWSGPGAIDVGLAIGQYVVPEDVLDETRGRADTFFEGTGLGVIRQYPVFCPRLQGVLEVAGRAVGRPVRRGGTYVCTQGPRLETPAEIRKYRMLGADYVGMTLCPEVFLAHELEICYAAILYLTNYAEGLKPAAAEPDRLFGGLMSPEEERAQREAVAALPDLIGAAAGLLSSTREPCRCQSSMERYRRSGRIGSDWRLWMGCASRPPTPS
ncbi:MAG: MTAP family purine nucleoside phosphorylase [Armatimonadetes bacterium]|nr:MTAP family purine nucleoside phosphorylase [Armatimonadota bacterium]